MELPYNSVISFLGISKRNEIRISKRCPSCSLQLYSSNQSMLKEISPGCLLEGLMLKMKLQYFGHLMRRADSLEKALMLEKIGSRRRRGQQRRRQLDAIINSMDKSLSKLWDIVKHAGDTGKPGMLQSMGSQRFGHD